MKEYKVWVELQGGYYTTVEANDLEEAMQIAINDADPFEVIAWEVEAETE